MRMKIDLLDTSMCRPVCEARVQQLIDGPARDLHAPVKVHGRTLLDGQQRIEALRRLGFKQAYVIKVPFSTVTEAVQANDSITLCVLDQEIDNNSF